MITIDGVVLRQTPISLLALSCGDFDFSHPGHAVARGAVVTCPGGCGEVVVTDEPVRSFLAG